MGYGDVFPITVHGRIFVGLMLVPIIGSIAISAFTNVCDTGRRYRQAIQAGDTVQALEDDPTIEPIEEWQREHERIIQRKRTGRAYQMRAYQMKE